MCSVPEIDLEKYDSSGVRLSKDIHCCGWVLATGGWATAVVVSPSARRARPRLKWGNRI
jgi:hypothetical protein